MPRSVGQQPAFEIKINGRALAPEQYNDIVLVEVRKGLDVVASARIEIHSVDLDACPFEVGQPVAVELGSASGSALTVVFAGTVLGLGCEMTAGGNYFTVDAYDDSYRLGRATVVKTHVKSTLGDVIAKMAGPAGLTPDVSGLPTITFESIQQYGTPHQFLTRLLRPTGCYWRVEGKTLVVRKRTEAPAGITVTAGEDLVSFRARVAASEQVSEVSVRGWDHTKQEAIVGTSTSATTIATPSVASQKLDDAPVAVAWSRTPQDASDADAMATALQQWMDDSRVTGRGEVWCNPAIVPGSLITVEGMGQLFNGDYHVSQVEHVMQGAQGFVTRFTVGAPEPAALVDLVGGGHTPTSGHFLAGVTIGIVTNLADPEDQARVKLKLPYLTDDEETGWARVVQSGAGSGRGWWMHPEVGDEVIVAFENGDPRLPIVIGGVWSKLNKAPDTAAAPDGKLENRSYTSAKGHLLNFDDGAKPAVEIKHGTKSSFVRLDSEKGIIVDAADQDLELKNKQASIKLAANGDITITGQNLKVDAKQKATVKVAMNAEVKADINLKLEGGVAFEAKGSMAKVEGSGQTEIKGGMVKIN